MTEKLAHIREFGYNTIHIFLQLLCGLGHVDLHAVYPAVALLYQLIKSFLTPTRDNDHWVRRQLVYSEGESTAYTRRRPDDEYTLAIVDTWHAVSLATAETNA